MLGSYLERELELAQELRTRLELPARTCGGEVEKGLDVRGWDWCLSEEEALDLLERLADVPEAVLEWPADVRLGRGRAVQSSGTRAQGSVGPGQGYRTDPNLERALVEVTELLRASPNRFIRRSWRLARDLRARAAERPVPASDLDEWVDVEVVRLTREQLDWRAELPKAVTTALRPYQVEGFRWLARLGAAGAGACLADDMGLGKTLQILAVLALRAGLGPALVVAPTSVALNWLREASLHLPRLCVTIWEEGREYGPWEVAVTTYGSLQEAHQVPHWATLVLDEAQQVKNPHSRRALAVRRLQASFRIAASGTPVENHLGELWSLFRFLNPGLLGPWKHFREIYQVPAEAGQERVRAAVRELIAPYILRRTKAQVAPELPPKIVKVLYLPLPRGERELYEALRREALDVLQSAGADRQTYWDYLTRLRQLCCHPSLVYPQLDWVGARVEHCANLLDDLAAKGHRSLVYSHFPSMLALVASALDQRGVAYEYFDGSTPRKERQLAVDLFQGDSAIAVFLISRTAGGTGITLTGADTVIHLDPWWNPAVEDQASDRVHRIGQQRTVTVYRYIAPGTVEEVMLDLQDWKRELADSLFGDPTASARVSNAQLLDLICAGATATRSARPAPPQARGELMTLDEVSSESGCSVPAVRAAVNLGTLPSCKVLGRRMVERKDFLAWLASRPPALTDGVDGWTSAEFTRLFSLQRGLVNSEIRAGELRARLVSKPGPGQFAYWIERADAEAWLARRAAAESVALRGEVLKLRHAAELFGISHNALGDAVRRGRLPARQRGKRLFVGQEDVAAYLRRDYKKTAAWTEARVLDFTGISITPVRKALKRGLLVAERRAGPDGRQRLEFEPGALAQWLKQGCAPYDVAVAHLSVGLTPLEASHETGMPLDEILAAIANLALAALPDGDGLLLSRYELDRWLLSLGRPTTRGAAGAPLVTVKQAVSLTGLPKRRIVSALEGGRLPFQWGPGRSKPNRLIARADLLVWATEQAPPDQPGLTVAAAAEQAGVSTAAIHQAVRFGHLTVIFERKPKHISVASFERWLKRGSEGLTLTALARQLGVPTTRLLKAIGEGQLKASKASNGRSWLIQWGDGKDWHENVAREPDWVTIPDAAREYGVSQAMLYGAIATGHLARRTDPVRVHRPELEAHYRQHWASRRTKR